MKNQIWIWLMTILVVACYEDKGNYTYHEINQLVVNKIDSIYTKDQFDTLTITPQLVGTMYNEGERFSYEWVINDKVIATGKNLVMPVELPLGKNESKFIITDKELKTKTYHFFSIYVTNPSASDAIVVLCNYKDKAELSYKRLDKDKPFQKVYYEKVMGDVLGTRAYKMGQNFYPYSRLAGLMLLTNEGLQMMDPTTMQSTGKYIDAGYVSTTARPIPNLDGYQVTGFENWLGRNMEFFGTFFIDNYSFVITEDALTLFQTIFVSSMTYTCKVLHSPYGGKLSPVVYPFYRLAGAGTGYDMAEQYLVFDETAGRFARCDVVAKREIFAIDKLKAFPGYQLVFGMPVIEKNYSVAVLCDDRGTKLLYLKAPKQGDDYQIEGEVDVPLQLMNKSSDFVMMVNSPHMFWKKGHKLYRYNISNIYTSGTAPSESDQIVSLDQLGLGYGADAEITCIFLSRSEKSILLGISRYGEDTAGNSDELKGDVVVLDAETYQVKNYYPAVAGYPVDILVKYQEHYRGGKDESGKMMDNI